MTDQQDTITASIFADAIKELPLSAIYIKVSELRNSIAHLHRSNDEMKAFITESCENDEDKRELETYISENEGVHVSMLERIALLKAEVEGRGQQWIEVANGTNASNTSTEQSALSEEAQPVANGILESEIRRDQIAQESNVQNAETEQEGIYL